MVEVPPMFNTALLPWVSPPVPIKAVATVKVVLLVRVTPVTVMLGIEIAVVPQSTGCLYQRCVLQIRR